MEISSFAVRRRTKEARPETRIRVTGTLILLVVFLYSCPGFVRGDEIAPEESLGDCVASRVIFDGVHPLSYAIVSADPTQRLNWYRGFPRTCDSAASTACHSEEYLLPGDTVAVGKSCDHWAYVQYLGKQRTVTGWVDRRRLSDERQIPPRTNAMVAGSPPTEPIFTLTVGANRPVCEAYLQRLNQTEFYRPAYCGRPENDSVPGFAILSRVLLTPHEWKGLAGWVLAITKPLWFLEPSQWESMNRAHGVISELPTSRDFTAGLRTMDANARSSWRYQEPIDINNNGTPNQVLIWRRDNSERPNCGSPSPGAVPVSERTGTIAFVLAPDGITIDQLKTIEVFGHPDGGVRTPYPFKSANGKSDFLRSFKPIGRSYGVFEFRHEYYFDTFFDSDEAGDQNPNRPSDFHDNRKNGPSLKNTLAVFQRRNAVKKQVCEYSVSPDQ